MVKQFVLYFFEYKEEDKTSKLRATAIGLQGLQQN